MESQSGANFFIFLKIFKKKNKKNKKNQKIKQAKNHRFSKKYSKNFQKMFKKWSKIMKIGQKIKMAKNRPKIGPKMSQDDFQNVSGFVKRVGFLVKQEGPKNEPKMGQKWAS